MFDLPSFTLLIPTVPTVPLISMARHDMHVYAMVMPSGKVLRNAVNPPNMYSAELVIMTEHISRELVVAKDRWGEAWITIKPDEADLLVCRAVNHCLRR